MTRLLGASMAFAASAALATGVAGFQPPEGGRGGPPGQGERKGGKSDKKGMKGFQLGWVLPPHVKDALELTADQEKKVDALERDVRAKLEKILTPDQIKRLAEIGPPTGGPGGPPRDE